ncbi:MAG: DUF2059 domain-containing protein [Gammaproteobacteria bacterium]|nr:MAG: DUF2059 domain-containing protein [Gammaproteobacteria bacterium]
MKLVMTLVFAMFAVFAAQAALAQDAKPSEESIRQLFEVMHSSKLLDAYMTQIDSTVRASMQQALAGQQLNPKQKKILEDMGAEIGSLVKAELTWPAIEPLMIEVYRDTFSQHEVDGMLAFYRSEVGQAVIAKLPTAMQQSMTGIQSHAQALTPKIVQLEKDTAAQVKAAGEAQHAPQSTQLPPAAPPPQPRSPHSPHR